MQTTVKSNILEHNFQKVSHINSMQSQREGKTHKVKIESKYDHQEQHAISIFSSHFVHLHIWRKRREN